MIKNINQFIRIHNTISGNDEFLEKFKIKLKNRINIYILII